MMQATKSWHRDYPVPHIRSADCFTTVRRSFIQREMRPVVVVVADVLIHQAFQMPFIQDNHMIKQIPAAVIHRVVTIPTPVRTSENVRVPKTSEDNFARAAVLAAGLLSLITAGTCAFYRA
jgi:hypothetical protein